jgi:hypothetical protein
MGDVPVVQHAGWDEAVRGEIRANEFPDGRVRAGGQVAGAVRRGQIEATFADSADY